MNVKQFHNKTVTLVGETRPNHEGMFFVHADVSWKNVLIVPVTDYANEVLDWDGGRLVRMVVVQEEIAGLSKRNLVEALSIIMVAHPDATDAGVDLDMF